MSKIKLGFHYHIPAVYRGDSIYMPGLLGVFVDSLAPLCESITCYMHSPRLEEKEQMDYKIRASNVTLVSMGPHLSIPSRILRSYIYKKQIYESLNNLDVLLVRGATVLTHIFSNIKITVAFLAVGCRSLEKDQSSYLSHLSLLRRFPTLLWYKWHRANHLKFIRKAIVFANSEVSYQLLQPIAKEIIKVNTTTLSAKDIFVRDDTCEGNIISLLFVGRFDRSKGMFELYNALSRLKDTNQKYHLYLVGWPAKGDSILEELDDFAHNLSLNQMITNLGYKGLGPELFDVYKSADMFVVPTKFDSFPRTILEAMAHSIPVIATKVGGIPHRLTNGLNAILIEPGDSKALADAIEKVANNRELRQKLIRNGRELASQNTLEIQSKKMICELEKYLRTK